MLRKIALAILATTSLLSTAVAQSENPASSKAAQSAFHREATGLKEFQDTKARLPKLRKQNPGEPVKAFIEIEPEQTGDDDKPAKTLTGYIKYNVGKDTTTAYEMVFDRESQKIISVKTDADNMAPVADESDDDAPKAKHKKVKDEDSDDEKPTHKKAKKGDDADDE